MVDPNLAAILDYLRDLANDTMACQFIFAPRIGILIKRENSLLCPYSSAG